MNFHHFSFDIGHQRHRSV